MGYFFNFATSYLKNRRFLQESNLNPQFIIGKRGPLNPVHLSKSILIELKKQNKKIVNLWQIRNSVIINWLKKYDVRKVQYLIGHKYVSSTERFQQNDLRDLQEDLDIFHPMR